MTPAPASYPVNTRLLTRMSEYMFPPPMKNQSDGTPYEKVDVIEIPPLDRLTIRKPTDLNGREFPYYHLVGETLVHKYIVMSTKKVAYDQLQNPKSDLHNVRVDMPILLHEEGARIIFIAVLHFFHGQRVLEVTHNSYKLEGFQDWKPWSVRSDGWMRWYMLKHRIVHRMDNIVTCKELLYDNPHSFEFHPSPDSLGSIVPIIDTIGWESLEDNVMEGK